MNIFKELFWALNLNQYCIWIWFYILNIWNIISDNSEIIYVPLDNPIVQYKNIQRNVHCFQFVWSSKQWQNELIKGKQNRNKTDQRKLTSRPPTGPTL